MKLHDITLMISNNMLVWPGDPKVQIEDEVSIKNGDKCNVKSIKLSSHTGTHIDAPNHFIDQGAFIDEVALDTLIGKCFVKDLTTIDKFIEIIDLQSIDFNIYKRVLFKTKNSKKLLKTEFDQDFVALSLDAAKFLRSRGVRLIGIDYLSIESFTSTGNVHKELLSNNITVLESLDLNNIKEGEYNLICLPLKIYECDGAPARVILEEYSKK